MLETLAQVFVEAAQPRSAHAAVDAVKGARLGWIDKLAAGLGHGRSLGALELREHRIGRNVGSDLSERWVSALLKILFTGTSRVVSLLSIADVL